MGRLLLLLSCLCFELIRAYYPPFVRPRVPSKSDLACLYFSGAGIYFWWQAGCAKYIRQYCDVSDIPIIGASAGSLTSTLLLTGVDFDRAADCAIDLAHQFGVYDAGKKSNFVFWGPLLRNWLEQLLPEELPDAIDQLQIAITPASPFKAPTLVSGFAHKEDLIDACMASCHVPLLLDGKPFTEYRGEKYLDGSFWYFVTKDRFTGLPIPGDMSPKNILWVDYCDDEEFMQSISGNILETVAPDSLRDMMQSGYRFMEREHYEGRLPIARFPRNLSVKRNFSPLVVDTPVFPSPKANAGPAMLPTSLRSILSNSYAQSSISAISAISLTALGLQQGDSSLAPALLPLSFDF